MPRAPGDYLNPREQQIMEAVFRRGRVTAAELEDALPGRPSNSTVRTLLRILEGPGTPDAHRGGGPLRLSPDLAPCQCRPVCPGRRPAHLLRGLGGTGLRGPAVRPRGPPDARRPGPALRDNPARPRRSGGAAMSDGLTSGAFIPWLVLLRDLSVKSALLLLTAWALTLGMRRTSAAARHLIWALTFAGLFLLPLLSATLPARPVPILPARSVAARTPPAAPVALSFPPAPSVAIKAPTLAVPDQRLAPPPPVRSLPAPTLPHARPDWPALLCLLWLVGVVLAAFPLAAGWLLAARRIQRFSPITDPVTLALAAEAGRQLGLRRPVFPPLRPCGVRAGDVRAGTPRHPAAGWGRVLARRASARRPAPRAGPHPARRLGSADGGAAGLRPFLA